MKLQDGLYWYREKGMLDANTYVIRGEQTVLIDPGQGKYLGLLLKEMQADGIGPKEVDVIAITHLHPDHCDATAAVEEVTGAKVAVHSSQWEYLDIISERTSRVLGIEAKKFEVDFVFEDSFEQSELRIQHTPGHSPDSICFFAVNKKALISGDLVFDKGVGRTDLPFGNTEELINSITTISRLETELLLPGHGAILKGQRNVKRNYEFIREYYL